MKAPFKGWANALPLLFLLASFGSGCSSQPETGRAGPNLAPDFVLEQVGGGQVRLSDYRGKVVLLHFWATWCSPCKAAIPHEMDLQERYGEEGFRVLGLSMDRKLEDVQKFLDKRPVNYPVALVDSATREAYGGVPTVPVTILVDRKGVIRKTQLGFSLVDIAPLEKKIERLLVEG